MVLLFMNVFAICVCLCVVWLNFVADLLVLCHMFMLFLAFFCTRLIHNNHAHYITLYIHTCTRKCASISLSIVTNQFSMLGWVDAAGLGITVWYNAHI